MLALFKLNLLFCPWGCVPVIGKNPFLTSHFSCTGIWRIWYLHQDCGYKISPATFVKRCVRLFSPRAGNELTSSCCVYSSQDAEVIGGLASFCPWLGLGLHEYVAKYVQIYQLVGRVKSFEIIGTCSYFVTCQMPRLRYLRDILRIACASTGRSYQTRTRHYA